MTHLSDISCGSFYFLSDTSGFVGHIFAVLCHFCRTYLAVDTHGYLSTNSMADELMELSNRGHVFLDGGIRWHVTGVFSNVVMQKKRYKFV